MVLIGHIDVSCIDKQYCVCFVGPLMQKSKTFWVYVLSGQLHCNEWAAILDSWGVERIHSLADANVARLDS